MSVTTILIPPHPSPTACLCIRRMASISTNQDVRAIKLQIVNKKDLKETGVVKQTSSWTDDMDKLPSMLDADEPCYIVFHRRPEVVLMCYVPEKCPVFKKMLYSSSKAAVRGGITGDHTVYFSNEPKGEGMKIYARREMLYNHDDPYKPIL